MGRYRKLRAAWWVAFGVLMAEGVVMSASRGRAWPILVYPLLITLVSILILTIAAEWVGRREKAIKKIPIEEQIWRIFKLAAPLGAVGAIAAVVFLCLVAKSKPYRDALQFLEGSSEVQNTLGEERKYRMTRASYQHTEALGSNWVFEIKARGSKNSGKASVRVSNADGEYRVVECRLLLRSGRKIYLVRRPGSGW